jgi:hypothetical protein
MGLRIQRKLKFSFVETKRSRLQTCSRSRSLHRRALRAKRGNLLLNLFTQLQYEIASYLTPKACELAIHVVGRWFSFVENEKTRRGRLLLLLGKLKFSFAEKRRSRLQTCSHTMVTNMLTYEISYPLPTAQSPPPISP